MNASSLAQAKSVLKSGRNAVTSMGSRECEWPHPVCQHYDRGAGILLDQG